MLAALAAMLASIIGELAIRAVLALGIGFATYKTVVEPVRGLISTRLHSAGVLADYVGWLGIDVAITIVLSAVIARAATNALKAHIVKKS